MPTALSSPTALEQSGSSSVGWYVSSSVSSVSGDEGVATDRKRSAGRMAASSRCDAFSVRPQAATSSGPSEAVVKGAPSRAGCRSAGTRGLPPVRSTA